MKFYPAQVFGLRRLRLCHLLPLMTVLLLFAAEPAAGMGLDFEVDPTISFSAGAQLVNDSSGVAAMTIQLSETVSDDVTIPFTVSGTAAGDGVDYTISASPLIIPVGELTAEIVVLLTADTVSEADETVVVTLETPTNAVLGASTVHTLTITESELPPVDPVDTVALPVYQRMESLVKTFPSPVDVAADRDGRIYVVDSYAGTVFRLSPGGRPIDSLAGLKTPVSTVVDGTGRVYIGSRVEGNVAVYDTDFNFLFKLGSGDGEFGHPGDIAVDSSGIVYVVDTKNNRVSRWDTAGNFIDLLGGPGDGNGQFNRPLSIAVDEIDQKIIILDRSNGARVQFFNMAGTYIAGWYKYSTAIGGLIRPQHIAVDGMHRLYISESAQNVVLVYDSNGSYLGAVYDAESPVRSPVGLAVSSTNMLYVASRASKKIEVYGLDEYATLQISPVTFSFTATAGGENPEPQPLIIGNSGTEELDCGLDADREWISISDDNGLLDQGESAVFEIAVDVSGLQPGEYNGTISVSAGPATEEFVQIMLTVLPAPPYIPTAMVSVTPETLLFTSEVGSLPYPQIITIENRGDALLNWEIIPEKSWMSVSRTSGTIAVGEAAQDVIVLADTASLTAGTYTGFLEVYGHGANNAIIDVSLALTTPDPGATSTPPPGTSWKGEGRRTWTVVGQTNGTALNSIWGTSSEIFAVGDSGTILHYDGLGWTEEILPTTLNLNGVWGSSASSVYAVGESGLLLHYDGESWSDVPIPFSDSLNGVWCSENSNCTTVGQVSTILASVAEEASWNEQYSLENSGALRAVWGITDSDLYVVGDFGLILHYAEGVWTSVEASTVENLYGIWGGAADDIYVAGQNGIILHYNGTSWTRMESGATVTLRAIWGNGADEVYAVGEDGTMLSYTGSQWNRMDIGIAEDLNDAWGGRKNEIYVVGSEGSIIVGRSSFPWTLFMPVLHTND